MRNRARTEPAYHDDPEDNPTALCACGGVLFFSTNWIGMTIEICGSCGLHQPMPLKVPIGFVRYESRLTLDAEITASVEQAKKRVAPKPPRANHFPPISCGKRDPNKDAA